MALPTKRNALRWIMIISSFVIVSLILWNTYTFFQYFKAEERAKMKSWTFAYNEYVENLTTNPENPDDFEVNEVAQYIVLDSTINTPMLLVDKNNDIERFRNIFAPNKYRGEGDFVQRLNDSLDESFVFENKNMLLEKLKRENEPLYIEELNQTLYYGNSPLLKKLKYYPLALLLIILLFGAVVYFFYRSSKNAEQNKLWTGMAKETAHQIGTPLSSLIGWTEILKSEQVNPDYISEIEKDVDRLQTITERFSKIGSVPTLKQEDIVAVTEDTFSYLKARSSKLIDFKSSIPNTEILVNLNAPLYSWTIENLVKNGIDAMKGKGTINLELKQQGKQVIICVSDTGKGIPKSKFNTIFQPGFTTKTRGWGLGLSLVKRIIEEYHNGKIKVLNSELNKGTTFQISLKVLS
ncbi:HAMP domain-containing sensor histidine kinase [Winogradskyella maritima]|uniref:histidine kinase n=1 Tax=Winogradskyella maritima TaxID=1517766 RepID=A0ABV8AI59_9FLAO|nr:HAMP domain-containing sensor histidine kinase [Winogradskyella maritima]